MKTISSIVSVVIITLALVVFNLVSCSSGGGGGGDVENDQSPPPSGSGTGANGITVFWYPYDTNIAVGQGNAVQETSDHGFVVAGTQADFQQNYSATPHDVFLMKTDSKGAVAWKKRFAWTGGAEAKAVRQTRDGGFIVTGQTITTNDFHRVYLLKTDAAGNAEAGWPKIFGSSNSVGEAVLELSDGYLIVGTRYVNAQDYEDVSVIRTDTAGNIRWEKDYHSFSHGVGDLGRSIVVTPDNNNYVITGATGYRGWKAFLLKIDGQGTELWSKVYGSSEDNAEAAYSVAAVPDGFVLVGTHRAVSGQPPVAGPADVLVIKTDVSGNELWRRTYGGADQDEAFSVAIDQNNDYLVFGYTQSYGGTVDQAASWQYQDLFLIKVDSSGNTIWQKVKGNSPPTSDFGNAVCAVSDGGFAVSGSSDGNVLLAKFDGNGETVNLGVDDLSITVPDVSGIIKSTNAVEVAAAGVINIIVPHDVGANSLDLLISTLKGVSDYCSSGSYTFSPNPSPSISTGTPYTLTFTDCVSSAAGASQTLNGSATITIDSVASGDLATASYEVQATLSALNITITETDGLSSTIMGGMRFSRTSTSGNFAEIAASVDNTTKLTLSEKEGMTTRTRALGPFSLHDSVGGTTGSYSYGAVNDTFTVIDTAPSVATVSFDGTVLVPVQGTGLGNEPSSGSFEMLATDNSKLTATITNGTTVISIDTNGDGTVDGTMSAAWDLLN